LPLLLAAKRLFRIGRFAESIQFLKAALEREPRNNAIRRMLAEMLERNGELDAGEEVAREAFKHNPEEPRIVRALAHILRRRRRAEEGLALLREYLRKYPQRETWRINHELAGCLDAQGDYPGALSALLRAKDELQPIARPLLEQWRQRAWRREQFAQQLEPGMLRRWRDAAAALEAPAPMAILAGHPRSGTTLLEQMLGRHPGIVTTDETGIVRRQFIEPLIMAAASTDAALAEIDAFDPGQLAAGRAFYFRATQAHLGEPMGGRLLVEKDPLATWDLGFVLRLLPESHIVFPLRDPRDVCVSFFFTILPFNADSAPAIDFASTCAAMSLTLRLWKHWRAIMPQSWHELKYERLVASPRGELIRLTQFLGLAFAETMLAHPGVPPSAGRGVVTPSYANVTEPLHARSIGRWRNYAPWVERHYETLAPLLREFGYA
jgi:tetratricopeptide (TPR) repeat protein